MTLQQHPLSAAFPAMQEADFIELLDSITDIGVQNPITLYEGMVLDGWNRYRAATAAGVPYPTQEFDGDDPVSFVKAQNKTRRHLTTGAWALVEVRLREWKPVGANQHRGSAPGAEAPQSTAQVSAETGISQRTLERAKVVEASAVADVQDAVLANRVSLKAAEQIARLPQEAQPEALAEATTPKKKARFKGKHKRGPKADADRAALKAAMERDKAAPEEPEQGEAPPDYTALDAAHDQIAELQAALALANLGDVSEEDRNHAKELIESLQAEVKSLNAQLAAVTQSRDYLMAENAQMKHQMAAQRRELDRLKTPAT